MFFIINTPKHSVENNNKKNIQREKSISTTQSICTYRLFYILARETFV